MNDRTKMHQDTRTRVLLYCLLTLALVVLYPTAESASADEIKIERNGQTTVAVGKILLEAQDGGILFLANTGRLILVQPTELKEKSEDASTAKPLDADKLAELTLAELPKGFSAYKTKHFVICHNTSRAYAKWLGSIYERLYRGFQTHWSSKRRWKISEPEGPLTIILFKTKAEYATYVKNELGQDIGTMVAYYNLLTNRVAMYDLTGMDDPTDVQIKRFVMTRQAHDMIATIVHEGTHQLIFNSGIQTRLADSPLWVNEGLAMYFETPDVRNTSGWKKIGVLNRPRLLQFRSNLGKGKLFTVEQMVGNDDVFRNSETASDAYAQAWAMNYYLFQKHSKKYVSYLKKLSEYKPLVQVSDEDRIKAFKDVFGEDLEKFQLSFVRYCRNIR